MTTIAVIPLIDQDFCAGSLHLILLIDVRCIAFMTEKNIRPLRAVKTFAAMTIEHQHIHRSPFPRVGVFRHHGAMMSAFTRKLTLSGTVTLMGIVTISRGIFMNERLSGNDGTRVVTLDQPKLAAAVADLLQLQAPKDHLAVAAAVVAAAVAAVELLFVASIQRRARLGFPQGWCLKGHLSTLDIPLLKR